MNMIAELNMNEIDAIGGAGLAQDAADFAKGVWEGICQEAHDIATAIVS